VVADFNAHNPALQYATTFLLLYIFIYFPPPHNSISLYIYLLTNIYNQQHMFIYKPFRLIEKHLGIYIYNINNTNNRFPFLKCQKPANIIYTYTHIHYNIVLPLENEDIIRIYNL